jgi:orotate phosphoribosyltransferase|tara:strand:+ start:232 stop:888 length:657 start_codon:yes stop_codon:yes gene_type:complete
MERKFKSAMQLVDGLEKGLLLVTEAKDTKESDPVELLESVGAILYGDFTLAHGAKSDYYIDSKQLTLDPKGARFVATELVRKLEEEDIRWVGGTAYSAIPIVSHICLLSGMGATKPISAFYNRKESKGHGRDQLAEGKIPPKGVRVAIVEDVVTSGHSLLDAIERAELQGCNVTNAIVLVDRNEGGREEVEKKGYKFWALFTVCRTAEGKVHFRYNGV